MESKIMLILAVLIAISVLPFVKADALQFTINEPIELSVYCFDANRTLCSATSTCNISVFYPDNTIFVDSQSMTQNGDYFNYTVGTSSIVGNYKAIAYCVDADLTGFVNFDFIVGGEMKTSESILSFGVIVSLLVATFLFFGISIKTSMKGIQIPFLLLSLFSIFSAITLGVITLQKTMLGKLLGAYSGVLLAVGGIAIAMVFVILIDLTKSAIDLHKIKRGLK